MCSAPVSPDVPPEHRGGTGTNAPSEEVRPVLKRRGKRFWSQGEPLVWATGAALAFTLALTFYLLWIVLLNGLGVFWPQPLAWVTLKGGVQGTVTAAGPATLTDSHATLDGALAGREIEIVAGTGQGQTREVQQVQGPTELTVAEPWETVPDATSRYVIHGPALLGERVEEETDPRQGTRRAKYKVGNKEFGPAFVWVDEDQIEEITFPEEVYKLDRKANLNYYGRLEKLVTPGLTVAADGAPWDRLEAALDAASQKSSDEIGPVEEQQDEISRKINADIKYGLIDLRYQRRHSSEQASLLPDRLIQAAYKREQLLARGVSVSDEQLQQWKEAHAPAPAPASETAITPAPASASAPGPKSAPSPKSAPGPKSAPDPKSAPSPAIDLGLGTEEAPAPAPKSAPGPKAPGPKSAPAPTPKTAPTPPPSAAAPKPPAPKPAGLTADQEELAKLTAEIELFEAGSDPDRASLLRAAMKAYRKARADAREEERDHQSLAEAAVAHGVSDGTVAPQQAELVSLIVRECLLMDEESRLSEWSHNLSTKRSELESSLRENVALFVDSAGRESRIALVDIVRFTTPNRMSTWDKIEHYVAKVWELLTADPREANQDGGLFPAIFGTVLLVFLMAVLCFPLGVLAGVYLGEYAKEGPLVRLVRIAVNNLAGIPSIVYGIFGLGFFVYVCGGSLDRWLYPAMVEAREPVFGQACILWASLTLGLLTIPVVIVSTEEALRQIPKGIKLGSYAMGATKFQTLRRLLVPMASPGMITGFILAMARAAGEVAPLMITGATKIAPVPVDGQAPYLHLDRQFMHLGFHVYDISCKSPNVEATKPLVYVTTLLLLLIVITLTGAAIWLRNRMKKRYQTRTI